MSGTRLVGRILDCDDHDPYAYPGAHEAECNNADEDCDGEDYCPPDLDGDRFSGPSDCDDRDPARHRGAAETLPATGPVP